MSGGSQKRKLKLKSSMKYLNKNPLFFAILFPVVADGVLTLVGQGPAYWANRVVNEASPVYYVLKFSPWLFIALSLVWFFVLYKVFQKLKEPLNVFLMFLLIAGHSWGTASWLWNLARRYNLYTNSNQQAVVMIWFLVVGYFSLIATFATFSLMNYYKRKE